MISMKEKWKTTIGIDSLGLALKKEVVTSSYRRQKRVVVISCQIKNKNISNF